MSHHFYLQNGSRRSAQAFPIAIAPGAKFSEAKETFGEMLGVPPEQIIRLTTADGGIVLPGQSIPEEPLILEVERRAFDMLTGAGTFAGPGSPLSKEAISNVFFPAIVTGAGTFASPGSPLSMGAISNVFFPALVVFVMFCGWAIILGGLASASDLCMTDSTSAWLLSNLFAWGSNSATVFASKINDEYICGLSLSLFWFIIFLEFFLCIMPAIILLFKAGSFSADTKTEFRVSTARSGSREFFTPLCQPPWHRAIYVTPTQRKPRQMGVQREGAPARDRKVQVVLCPTDAAWAAWGGSDASAEIWGSWAYIIPCTLKIATTILIIQATTTGSWAYIITCTLNITTTILIIQAYVVVPGSYYAGAINQALIPIRQVAPGTPANFADPFDSVLRDVPADYVRAVQTMAAGVIILLVANFCWIYAQVCDGGWWPGEWGSWGLGLVAWGVGVA
eukprot:gene9086-16207_t